MKSEETTVEGYLASLPEDRRNALVEVRKIILGRLKPGFEEVMNWGMITYQVPLATYPDTYNKKPLMYAALASQKNNMAVYLTGLYSTPDKKDAFVEAYRATGKRCDVGKSCVRFKKIDDLPLDLVGGVIAEYTADEYVTLHKATRSK